MIELRNVGKFFKQPGEPKHHVFRNINLILPPNVDIAVLGKNGSGKSTLLKMIGGVLHPDSGRVLTNKKISWPIGLGTGLQRDLTGLDNVKFVCRVYGQTKEEMWETIDFVRDCADIGDDFNRPVKLYSTGTRARFNFSLCMAFDFDYYLIDEVTAVGDSAFRARGMAVFNERRKNANQIMVLHNIEELRRQCQVGVVIFDKDDVRVFDSIDEAIDRYYRSLDLTTSGAVL